MFSPSPEDKRYWVIAGAEKERDFVERVLPTIGFSGVLNPAKTEDPYAPDLVVEGHLADLKCQRTPFFKAGELHMVDPQFAVTPNRKDWERYSSDYPSLDLYFWIDWQETRRAIGGFTYEVEPMAGVWRASFPAVNHAILNRSVRSHDYLHRVFDESGNAKSSFVLDVRRFEFLGGWPFATDDERWMPIPPAAATG